MDRVSRGALNRAHRHSFRNRGEVVASARCACFHCGAMFAPADVRRWTDVEGGVGATAVCPRCNVDAVLASRAGFPLSPAFLTAMRRRWFERIAFVDYVDLLDH